MTVTADTAVPSSRRERAGAWVWALVLLGCAALLMVQLVRGSPWDTRITSLLPVTQQTALLAQAESQLTAAIENRLIILVGGENPRDKAGWLQRELREREVISPSSPQLASPEAGLSAQRYHLLADSLRSADAGTWAASAASRLYTPGFANDLRLDPFGLLDAWVSQQFGPLILDGELPLLTQGERRWLMVTGELTGSPYDMALQQRLEDSLAAFADAHPGTPLLRAGLVFHAAAGAAQARQEISTIGLGSLLGILALLWLVFRDTRTLLSLLIPLGCGLLFALPLTWLIFGTLNLLTLAFGASLIGVAIDYAMHLQCARHLDPERPLRELWPALKIGLYSSLAAYMVQLATPMPGLQQMATFALLGLVGAWVTVRFWLPLLPVYSHPATGRLASRLALVQLPAGARWPWLVLLGSGILSAGLISAGLHGSDDLRELNTSPPELIDEQSQVQALVGGPSGRRYLLVMAADQGALLTRLEALDESLSELSAAGQLDHYRHIAQAVPSAATQKQNLREITQRYAAALPLFIQSAGLPSTLGAQMSQSLDLAQPLTITQWLNSPLGERDQALWIPATSQSGPAALITLGEMSPGALAAIAQLAEHDDVLFQDTVARLSAKLSRLRDTIALWLAAAVVGLALLFAWRYRSATWRVMLPPVGAVVATLAILSAMGTGLTLFHLLGLLLVLGIGLDAGIFSVEHAASRAAWMAVTLSCASSLLAFGLLALSSTPALAQLGTTCLLGLTFAWLLVPFARAGWPTTRLTHPDRK